MTETKTKQSIKESVREHYNAASLSNEQVDRLQQMQQELLSPQDKLKAMEAQLASRAAGSTPSEKILSLQEDLDPEQIPSISTSYRYPQPARERSSRRFLWVGALAVAAVALAAFFFLLSQGTSPLHTPPARASLTQAAVAYHSQHTTPALATSSLANLRQQLANAPFTVVASTHLPARQWTLEGGSLTQIQKQPAVVLYYRNHTDQKRYSLFQMAPWSHPSLQHAWQGRHKQTSLKLWQERGLVLLLVGP